MADPGGADAEPVAIVTGAASGIGRAVAERLRAGGWRVVVADVAADRLDWVPAGDDGFTTCVADVAGEAGNAAMVAAATEGFGRLDGLVLNAGVGTAGPIDGPIDELDRLVAVNLRGVVLGLQAAMPALRAARGAVVVTASVSGLFGDPGMWAYNATKGGAMNFARAAAIDLAPDGVRVNAVCPGPIADTGMTAPLQGLAPDLYEEMRSNVPLRRWGAPDEVAAAVEFLLSPDASYITGVALPVDGGVTAGTGLFRGASAGA